MELILLIGIFSIFLNLSYIMILKSRFLRKMLFKIVEKLEK